MSTHMTVEKGIYLIWFKTLALGVYINFSKVIIQQEIISIVFIIDKYVLMHVIKYHSLLFYKENMLHCFTTFDL